MAKQDITKLKKLVEEQQEEIERLKKKPVNKNGGMFGLLGDKRNLETRCFCVPKLMSVLIKGLKRKILAMIPGKTIEKGVLHRCSLIRLKGQIQKGKKIQWGSRLRRS